MHQGCDKVPKQINQIDESIFFLNKLNSFFQRFQTKANYNVHMKAFHTFRPVDRMQSLSN